MITCPKCSEIYDANATISDVAGKKLQCGSCQNRWSYELDTKHLNPRSPGKVRRIILRPARDSRMPDGSNQKDNSENVDDSKISGAALSGVMSADPLEDHNSANPKPSEFNHWLNIAAVIGALMIFGGGLLFRDEIVSVVPSINPLYKLAGIDIYQSGLKFNAVKTKTGLDQGREILVVEGLIRNETNRSRELPAVRLVLRGKDSRKIRSWIYEPRQKKIAAGESVSFSTSITAPPETARDIQLKFTKRAMRKAELD